MLTALALAGSAIVLARGAHAQTPDSQSAATRKPVHPIGIGLEEIEYPYSVKFFDLTIEGQQVCTAYMDVPPTAAAKGKTVVLLHGKSFSGNHWAHMIATLTALGYRVVVSDQIGFGKSAKPDIRYRFDPLARNTKICSTASA